MLLGNILLSLYFSTLGEDRQCPTSPGSALCWTPAIATCVFFLGFGSGLGNVLFVLMAEVRCFNTNTKIDKTVCKHQETKTLNLH